MLERWCGGRGGRVGGRGKGMEMIELCGIAREVCALS